MEIVGQNWQSDNSKMLADSGGKIVRNITCRRDHAVNVTDDAN